MAATFTCGEGSGVRPAGYPSLSTTGKKMPDIRAWTYESPRAPTFHSNWMLPGLLAFGQSPGGVPGKRYSVPVDPSVEVQKLHDLGITCFVCCQGEWESAAKFRYEQYPKDVTSPKTSFVFFPIADHAPVDPAALVDLVIDLMHRLERGQGMYVHCRGGHGRSGMVVCALLMGLFDCGAEEAMKYATQARRLNREAPVESSYQVPETENQIAVLHAVEKEIREISRARRAVSDGAGVEDEDERRRRRGGSMGEVEDEAAAAAVSSKADAS